MTACLDVANDIHGAKVQQLCLEQGSDAPCSAGQWQLLQLL